MEEKLRKYNYDICFLNIQKNCILKNVNLYFYLNVEIDLSLDKFVEKLSNDKNIIFYYIIKLENSNFDLIICFMYEDSLFLKNFCELIYDFEDLKCFFVKYFQNLSFENVKNHLMVYKDQNMVSMLLDNVSSHNCFLIPESWIFKDMKYTYPSYKENYEFYYNKQKKISKEYKIKIIFYKNKFVF